VPASLREALQAGDAGGPSLRVAGFEDEDEDSGSTELAEVLPDEALPSLVGSSVSERSREYEAPGEGRSPFYLYPGGETPG
jgi:hypothetical protein